LIASELTPLAELRWKFFQSSTRYTRFSSAFPQVYEDTADE
jgi:hypothetical protein